MSEEQARQRAQELTKKALAEAENETFKIDRSLQGKHIVTKSEKAAKKKEENWNKWRYRIFGKMLLRTHFRSYLCCPS